jgi:hypothetical protein
MINLPRRNFIKKLSLCTLLIATGNVRQGLSYISPVLDKNNNFIIPEHINNRICFMGIGETGLQIGRSLSKGLYRLPADMIPHDDQKGSYKNENPIKTLQFNPYQQGFNALLEKRDLVFLSGSLEDENLWIARDLILKTGTRLLINIIPSNPDIDITKAASIPRPNESFISMDENDFTQSAINVVRDICSLLLLPNIICIDFVDIKEALEGTYSRAFYVESPLDRSIDRFRSFVLRNKHFLMNADTFCLALSYDYRTAPTLGDMTKISDELYKNSKKDADFMCSCTNVQRLNTEFRATLLSGEKYG